MKHRWEITLDVRHRREIRDHVNTMLMLLKTPKQSKQTNKQTNNPKDLSSCTEEEELKEVSCASLLIMTTLLQMSRSLTAILSTSVSCWKGGCFPNKTV